MRLILPRTVILCALALILFPELLRAQPDPAFDLKAERLEKIIFQRPRKGTAFELWVRHYRDADREADLTARCRTRLAAAQGWMRVQLVWGLLNQSLQQHDEALQAFQRSCDLDQDNYYPRMLLAEELLRKRDTDAAASELSKAIALNAPRADYLLMAKQLAQLYLRLGDRQRAQQLWNQIAEKFAGDARVLTELANLLQNERQFDAALRLWQSVETLARDDPFQRFDARLHIAQICLQTGQQPRALNELGSLLDDVKPGSWRADSVRRLIEQALLNQGGPESLVRFWSDRLKGKPDDLASMAELAGALSRANRDRQAAEQYRQALQRAPRERGLHEGLIALYIRQGDFPSAIQQTERLAEIFPADADLWQGLGKRYLQQHDGNEAKQQAIEAWQKIAALQPDDAAAAVRVAEACRTAATQQGSHSASPLAKLPPEIRQLEALLLKSAEEYYREAVRRDPEAAQYHEYLGEFLHVMDRPDEAVAAWNRMAESDLPAAWNELSRVLTRFGYLEAAIEAASKAADRDSTNIDYRKQLVELLSRHGRHQQARETLADWPATADDQRWEEMAIQLRVELATDAGAVDAEVKSVQQQVAAQHEDYQAHWTLARLLTAKGQTAEAAAAMEQAVQLRPDDVRLIRQYANMLESADRPQLAAAQYRRLVKLQPEWRRDDYQRIVGLELRQNHLPQAAEAAQQLIQVAPSDPESHLLKATVATRQGDAKTCIASLQRAVHVAPRDLAVRRQLATALRLDGQSQASLDEAYECFKLAESLAEKRSVLAWIFDGTPGIGERRWLVQRVRQDRQLQTDSYMLTLSLVQLLERMERFDEAIEELTRLQIQHPTQVGILQDLVRLAEVKNDIPLAVTHQQQLVRFDNSPKAMEHLARLYRQDGRLEDAAGIWDALLDKTVSYRQAVTTVDRLLKQEDLFQAQRFAEAGLARFPDSWQLAYRSGLIHLAMAQPAAARSALALVVRLPDEPAASSSGVYQELLLASQAHQAFRVIGQRIEQHGARNPRTLRQFFDPQVLQAGGSASPGATRIYAAAAALTLAYGPDDTPAWLGQPDDSSYHSVPQLRRALVAAWATYRGPDCRRLMKRLSDESPDDPLPHILPILNPPFWQPPAPVTVGELQASHQWLAQNEVAMARDTGPICVSRLFHHPDQDQVRQFTAAAVGSLPDWPSLSRLIPLIRKAQDPEINARVLARVGRLFPPASEIEMTEGDLQSIVRLAIDLSDANDGPQLDLTVRLFDALLAQSLLKTPVQPPAVVTGSRIYGKLIQQLDAETASFLSQRGTLRQGKLPPARRRLLVNRLAWAPQQRSVIRSVTTGSYWVGKQMYRTTLPPRVASADNQTQWFPVATSELDDMRLQLLQAMSRKMQQADRSAQWLQHLQAKSAGASADQATFRMAQVAAAWFAGRQADAVRLLQQMSSGDDAPAHWSPLLVQAHIQRGDLQGALQSVNSIKSDSGRTRVLRRAIAAQWAREALQMTLEGHTGAVTSVAFSPNGRWLASGGVDRTVRLWDTATGELAARLGAHEDGAHEDIVLAVAFSPRGDRLVSVGYDRVVRIWGTGDGKLIAGLDGHESTIRAVAFSPDGELLATAGDDRVVLLWDAAGGKVVARLDGHVTPVTSLSFNYSGTKIASASSDGHVRIWDIGTQTLDSKLEANDGVVRAVVFLDSDRRLSAGYDDGVIRIWEQTGKEWTSTRVFAEAGVRSIAYDKHRDRVALGSDDHSVQLRDADTGREQMILRGHAGRVVTVAFSPAGDQLVSAGFDGNIKLWSTGSAPTQAE